MACDTLTWFTTYTTLLFYFQHIKIFSCCVQRYMTIIIKLQSDTNSAQDIIYNMACIHTYPASYETINLKFGREATITPLDFWAAIVQKVELASGTIIPANCKLSSMYLMPILT